MCITAIIVNYHTASLLLPLLKHLEENPLVSQIVIADNSNELSASGFQKDFSTEIRMILNGQNRGFGAAVNQAAAYADKEWILLVNPDIRFEENCIARLLDAARKYNTPLAGPRFYWDDEMSFRLPPSSGSCLWTTFAGKCAEGYQLDAEMLSFYWMLRHDRFWNAVEPFYEPFLSGACILIEKKWISDSGGSIFDERFFLYYEDTDLCARAVCNGIRPICVPDAKAVHYYDQAPSPDSPKSDLMHQSFCSFFSKYYKNIRLPEIQEKYIPFHLEDMGTVKDSPQFQFHKDMLGDEQYFLEIGINSFFVPFAQTFYEKNFPQIPTSIWSHLSPGQYFTRIRAEISGTRRIWKWEKTDS
ncbi:MAG: glycosyltransferase [Desulfococcaceae bacterium]